MYIVIVGGGRLGYNLLKALLNEGHEVLVLEKNPRVCKTITDEVGSVCHRGDGCEAATLAEVGTGRADMLVCSAPPIACRNNRTACPTDHPVEHVKSRGVNMVRIKNLSVLCEKFSLSPQNLSKSSLIKKAANSE